MAERKVEVEINGKRFRVAEHLVSDMLKFGASLSKRNVKEPPKELLQMLPKKIILPKEKVEDKTEFKELPPEIILPVESTAPDLELPAKKPARKVIRSKK